MKLERHHSHSPGEQPDGRDAVLRDGPRRRVLWLMVEFFRTLGYSDVKARLPGHSAPTVLNGTLEDHRPDLTCRQDDRGKTAMLLEVVLPEAVDDPDTENRWSLLASSTSWCLAGRGREASSGGYVTASGTWACTRTGSGRSERP
jgi:hypothetical protein